MDSPQTIEIIAQMEDEGLRADRFLAQAAPDGSLSRTRLQQLMREGSVQRNDSVLRDVSMKISAGDHFIITLPSLRPSHIQPRAMALDIVYEDDDLIIINKPAGLPVHPAPGHQDDTLVNALLHHCGGTLSGIGGEERPGIVHRLDMDTTGLIVAAKTALAHHGLARQFASRGKDGKDKSMTREYLALVWGWPPPGPERIDAPIGRHPIHRRKMAVRKYGGRQAITQFRLRERISGSGRSGSGGGSGSNGNNEIASLLACRLLTGRTHQIRVHLAWRGWPVIGDPLYRQRKNKNISLAQKNAIRHLNRQALHAAHLGFIHPRHKRVMRFDSPLPKDIHAVISVLKS